MKLVMALTGLVWLGYLAVHMYGNLKAFSGQEAFDGYAHHLREIGEPMLPYGGLIWITRVVLLASIVLHVLSAIALWKRARAARPQKYVVKKAVVATFSSKMMRWGGVAILAFIIFHILHLTTHTINPGGNPDSPYVRMVDSFEIWWVSAIYVIALIAVGLHLRHGVWSGLQTLGFTTNATRRTLANTAAIGIAVVIAGGFILVPLSVVFGLITT